MTHCARPRRCATRAAHVALAAPLHRILLIFSVAIFVCAACVAPSAFAATPAFAQSASDLTDEEPRVVALIDALDASGYHIVSINTTLLNRVRVRAENDHHLREIVMSQSTGQILRDTIVEEYGDAGPPTLFLFPTE